MDTKELRVGNYIIVYDYIIRVSVEILLLISYVKKNSINPHYDYKPITITEELLLKFGFEKKAGRDGYLWVSENLSLGSYSNEKELDIRFNPQQDFGYISVKLKYVHQLQNLYFALTGEELILNEPIN